VLTNSVRISRVAFWVCIGFLFFVHAVNTNAQGKPSSTPKIYAQKLVEETLATHSELVGLELALRSGIVMQFASLTFWFGSRRF
jgi:hypothetical protein